MNVYLISSAGFGSEVRSIPMHCALYLAQAHGWLDIERQLRFWLPPWPPAILEHEQGAELFPVLTVTEPGTC